MMSVCPINLEVNCFQLQSIRDHAFLEVLRSFNQLIVTSIGPRGQIKIIESGGGITVVTTSSKRIIDMIELDNPLLHVISNAMKNQLEAYADFGLCTGLTSTTLLLKVLNDRLPYNTMSSLIRYHTSVTISLIDELRKVFEVDFSSLECMIKIVETVIYSKPLCCDPSLLSVVDLAVCIVGAFIRGISETVSLGNISVIVNEGPLSEPPACFTGILYDSPELNESSGRDWNIISDKNSKIMVVLFAVNLTASNQNGKNSGENFILDQEYCQESALLEKIEKTCNKLLGVGVKVFACQKVIHPHTKWFLQKNGALALERMGKNLADSFAALTGALPLGCQTFDEVPDGCIGELESVKIIERGGRTYLCLERDDDKNGGIATILVNGAGEQQAAELKVVIYQSLQTLHHLASKPYVLPGSGCLEAWLAVQLQKRILSHLDELCEEHNCSSVEMLAVLKWFRNTFFTVSKRISGNGGSYLKVDSFYYHCWQSSEAENCACGLLTKEMCDGHGAGLIDIEIEANEEKMINLLSSMNSALLNDGQSNEVGILFPKVFLTVAACGDENISNMKHLKVNCNLDSN